MQVETEEPASVDTTAIRTSGLGSQRTLRKPTSVLWYLFAAGLLLGIVGPVLLFFTRMFEDGGAAFERVLAIPDIWGVLWTTLGLAVASTLIAAVVAVVLAVLATKVSARLRGFAAMVPLIPLVIPPVAMIYGWIFIFSPEVGYANILLRSLPFLSGLETGPFDVYSVNAIILIPAVDLVGLIFAFVYARLLEINGSVNAAARVAGASALKSFFTIALPLLRPALVAGIVVAFLTGVGQFSAPLFLGGREGISVLSTEIFRIRENFPIDYPLTAVLGLPLLIFGVLAITIQRRVTGDQRKYVTQGLGRGIAGRTSRWASAVVVLYGVVVVALPIAALALVAFSPYWNGDLFNIQFTLANFQTAIADPRVGQAIWNSIITSFLTVLIAIPIGFLTALALAGVVRAPKFVSKTLEYVFLAPLAVPRALLGMVVIFVFIRPPFSLYGTLTLFVIGYLFIALPYALRSQHASLIGVDKGLFEAARVSGASPARMILTIALPSARRGIAAALALSFVMLTNDFAVSVMVQSANQNVLGTLLFVFSQGGSVSQIAVLSLIMTLITAVILGIVTRIGGKSVLETL